MADVRTVAPDDWPLWRDVRLSALADAPDAFGARLVEWEAADERRWRQRLEDVPFNVIAVSDGLPIGQASGTAADEDGRVELISMWVAPAARGTGTASALVDAVTEPVSRRSRQKVKPISAAARAAYLSYTPRLTEARRVPSRAPRAADGDHS